MFINMFLRCTKNTLNITDNNNKIILIKIIALIEFSYLLIDLLMLLIDDFIIYKTSYV